MNYKVISSTMYNEFKEGFSFSGERVVILGEQLIEFESGKKRNCFVYNIVGHAPANGRPFIALKSNIVVTPIVSNVNN